MARNASGTYSLPSPQNPVVDDTPITTDWANTTLDDIATEITNSIDKGGRTTPTANLPMGGFKLTGLAAGSANGDSVRYEQISGFTTKGADIASAATVNLDAATGEFVHITGTTTITAITLASGSYREVVFDGALTLTHNATSLILPGGANITTAAGDRAGFRGDGTGNVRCVWYTKADGSSITPAAAATQAEMEAASSNTVMATPANVNWHPGVAKAWIKCNAAGAIQASHNITSITDNGTGDVTVTIATDFSSVNYAILPGNISGQAYVTTVQSTSQAAGVFQGITQNPGSGTADPNNWFFACFGDQ